MTRHFIKPIKSSIIIWFYDILWFSVQIHQISYDLISDNFQDRETENLWEFIWVGQKKSGKSTTATYASPSGKHVE